MNLGALRGPPGRVGLAGDDRRYALDDRGPPGRVGLARQSRHSPDASTNELATPGMTARFCCCPQLMAWRREELER